MAAVKLDMAMMLICIFFLFAKLENFHISTIVSLFVMNVWTEILQLQLLFPEL